jgi:hypothetical protein
MIYHLLSTGVTLPPGPQWYEQGLPGGLELYPSPMAVEMKFMRGTAGYTHSDYERNFDLKKLNT